jgi:hypothetical protein
MLSHMNEFVIANAWDREVRGILLRSLAAAVGRTQGGAGPEPRPGYSDPHAGP